MLKIGLRMRSVDRQFDSAIRLFGGMFLSINNTLWSSKSNPFQVIGVDRIGIMAIAHARKGAMIIFEVKYLEKGWI